MISILETNNPIEAQVRMIQRMLDTLMDMPVPEAQKQAYISAITSVDRGLNVVGGIGLGMRITEDCRAVKNTLSVAERQYEEVMNKNA